MHCSAAVDVNAVLQLNHLSGIVVPCTVCVVGRARVSKIALARWRSSIAEVMKPHIRDKIRRADPNYIDEAYIPEAEAMLQRILYVPQQQRGGHKHTSPRPCFLRMLLATTVNGARMLFCSLAFDAISVFTFFAVWLCVLVHRRQRSEELQYLKDKPWLVHACFHLNKNTWFEVFMIFVIIANTVTLSVDYYGIPQSTVEVLNIANVIFSTLFAGEMLIKLFGEGVWIKSCALDCPSNRWEGGL